MKNTYLVEFEKYKDCSLPRIDEYWFHPTERKGDKSRIEYRVLSYTETHGEVETIHSKRVQLKTLHWIRKMYNYNP